MHPIERLITKARNGHAQNVQILVGNERFLIDRAIKLLRAATIADGVEGLNEESFEGKGLSASTIIDAAQTLPMMAARRFILVRRIDQMATDQLARLSAYVQTPCDSACVVLTAERIDGRSKLAKQAKDAGVIFEAKSLRGRAVSDFVVAECKSRGHAIKPQAVAALLDSIGEDLSLLDGAIEKLSLYAGQGATIDDLMVEHCISSVRMDSIWSLVDAVGSRDVRQATLASASLLANREPPLRLLAMIARQLRMIAKTQQALTQGMNPNDAAKFAGVPPFKAADFSQAARRFTDSQISNAFEVIAKTDRALKGSKRPPDVVLQQAVLWLCAGALD